MTPTRRRTGTPASQGPTRTAPDVPVVAAPKSAPPAEPKDGTQLLGPEGEPTAEGDAGGDSARTQSQRRPGGLYPLPVWPD